MANQRISITATERKYLEAFSTYKPFYEKILSDAVSAEKAYGKFGLFEKPMSILRNDIPKYPSFINGVPVRNRPGLDKRVRCWIRDCPEDAEIAVVSIGVCRSHEETQREANADFIAKKAEEKVQAGKHARISEPIPNLVTSSMMFSKNKKSQKGFVGILYMGVLAALSTIPLLVGGHAKVSSTPSPPPPLVPIATVERIIKRASIDTGVPHRLLHAVAVHESALRSDAVSKVGARGVMQTMPDVARENGCAKIDEVVCEVYAGSRYLGKLLKRYHGNVRLSVAAYNAGPGAVDYYHGVPPFAETRSYVTGILADIVVRRF